jgi:hypothetical protein
LDDFVKDAGAVAGPVRDISAEPSSPQAEFR